MSELILQAQLRSGDTELTCWVDRHVNAGDKITLDEREWDVLWVSTYSRPV